MYANASIHTYIHRYIRTYIREYVRTYHYIPIFVHTHKCISILSYLILSYLILSYLILSYLILSYLILSYLSIHIFVESYTQMFSDWFISWSQDCSESIRGPTRLNISKHVFFGADEPSAILFHGSLRWLVQIQRVFHTGGAAFACPLRAGQL